MKDKPIITKLSLNEAKELAVSFLTANGFLLFPEASKISASNGTLEIGMPNKAKIRLTITASEDTRFATDKPLADCPACGKKPSRRNFNTLYWVECSCGVRGPQKDYNGPAVDDWNKMVKGLKA
jgi:hypothetical protein